MFKYFLLVLKFLPYVISIVKAVEETIGAGNGVAKKALIMDAVAAAAKVGDTVPEDHVKIISTLIDSTVTSLNASGIFKK